MTDWKTDEPTGLEEAIKRFKQDLPGWWYRIGACQVSADASCGPTRESEHIGLIEQDKRFDEGFDADLPMPATMADALNDVRKQALEAVASTAKPKAGLMGGSMVSWRNCTVSDMPATPREAQLQERVAMLEVMLKKARPSLEQDAHEYLSLTAQQVCDWMDSELLESAR